MCSHELRSLWSYGKQHDCSTACLFVDAIGAFDSVVRDLIFGEAFGDECSDEKLAAIFKHFGFAPEDIHALFEEIAAPSCLQRADVPTHAQKVTSRDTH